MATLAVVAAATLWRADTYPPAVDAGVLAAGGGRHLDGEVVVTGEWSVTGPAERGHVVVLRGRNGDYVDCHFEDVSAADRDTWEAGLLWRRGKVMVRGRYDGVKDGRAVLRGCRLLD